MSSVLRVLVVEDETLVRELAVEFLEDEGFDVTEAETGDRAARLLISPDGYHAVFTDVRMPGVMDGVDLAHHARKLSPKIPVIVTSAYAQDVIARLQGVEPPFAFFSKPYRSREIVAELRRLTAAA
jgi:CheY-like chemotaxis protein